MSDRYDTSVNPEGQYQPGSDDQVLLNRLGITDVEEMEGIEFDALVDCQLLLFDSLEIDSPITANDLCLWHKQWLGNIYEWAGEYRSVNMEKDGFLFAAAHLLPKLMAEFEKKYLAVHTPCNSLNRDELVKAMAICHIEFIIIHPFREGNGRLGRLLNTVMALQANMPVLDFGYIEEDKSRYVAAIHAGHGGDYQPMEAIFSEILNRSIEQNDPI